MRLLVVLCMLIVVAYAFADDDVEEQAATGGGAPALIQRQIALGGLACQVLRDSPSACSPLPLPLVQTRLLTEFVLYLIMII